MLKSLFLVDNIRIYVYGFIAYLLHGFILITTNFNVITRGISLIPAWVFFNGKRKLNNHWTILKGQL